MDQMKGKVAIVTGASRGIGKAIAIGYAGEGARVVVAARTEIENGRFGGTIHQTVKDIESAGGQAMAVHCDVTDATQVQELIKATMDAYGRIDVLMNNAGIAFNPYIKDTEDRHMALILRVNVLGPMLLCKYVVQIMEAQRSGSIINMTSGAGVSRSPGRSAYSISKAGLNQLTYSLAAEEKPFNIAVNALDPGGLITEGSKSTHPVDYEQWAKGRDPVEAIVPPAVALALKDSNTMTGQVLKRVEHKKTWN